MPVVDVRFSLPHSRKYKTAIGLVKESLGDGFDGWATLFGWVFTHALGKVMGELGASERSRSWIDEWLLGKIIFSALQDYSLDEDAAHRAVMVIKILTIHQHWSSGKNTPKKQVYQVLQSWLSDQDIQGYLQVNRYQNVLWFNQEAYESLLRWMLLESVVETISDLAIGDEEKAKHIVDHYDVVKQLQDAGGESDYQIEKLLEAVKR